MSDAMYQRAFPLVRRALDGFRDFDAVHLGFSDSGMAVTANTPVMLDAAYERLYPVFTRAGWGFRGVYERGTRTRLVFTPPGAPMRKPSLRVVR